MADEDDLSLAISLVLEADDPEMARAFSTIVDRLRGSAEADFGKLGESAGKAASAKLKEQFEKGFKAAIESGGKGALQAQKASNTALGNLLDDYLKRRRQAQTAADTSDINQEKASLDRRATTQKEGWRKRLTQLSADLKAEFEDLRHNNAETEQAQKASDRSRLQATLIADRQRETAAKAAAAQIRHDAYAGLEDQKQANRAANTEQRQANSIQLTTVKAEQKEELAETRGHQQRLAQLNAAFLRGVNDTYRTGLRLVSSTIRTTTETGLRSIAAKYRSHLEENNDAVRSGLASQEAATRIGLERENTLYTSAARQQLETVARSQAEQVKVVTAGGVKQAAAITRAREEANRGVLGAISNATGIGGAGILGLVGGLGAGAGIKSAITDYKTLGGVVLDLQRRIGGGAQSLSKLEFAAQQSGISAKSLQTDLQRLAVNASAGKVDGYTASLAAQAKAEKARASALVAVQKAQQSVNLTEERQRITASTRAASAASGVTSAQRALDNQRTKDGITNAKKLADANQNLANVSARVVQGDKNTLANQEAVAKAEQRAASARGGLTPAQNLALAVAQQRVDAASAKTAGSSALANLTLASARDRLAAATAKVTQITTQNAVASSLLGFSVHDANGKLLPFDTILQKIADKFHDMPNGLAKTNLAIKLFGKGGSDMIRLLNGGSAALAGVEAQAQKYGLVLTTQNLVAVQDSIQATRKQAAAWAGLKITLAKDLLPTVTALTTATVTFLQDLVNGQGVWKTVRTGLEGIAIGLAAIIAEKAAVQVLKLVGDGVAALAANPLVAVVGVLSLLGVVLFKLASGNAAIKGFWDGLIKGTKDWAIVGYKIGEPIKGLSALVLIQSSVGAAARAIVTDVQSIIAVVEYLVHGGSFSSTEKLLGGVFDSIPRQFDHLKAPIETAIHNLAAVVTAKVRSEFAGIFFGVAKFVRLGGFGDLKSVVLDALETAFDIPHNFVDSLFHDLFHGVKPVDLLTRSGVGERSSVDSSIAAVLSTRLHNIYTLATKNGGDFLGSLFKGTVGTSGAAQVGAGIRAAVSVAIAEATKGADFIGSLLGKGTRATKPVRDWLGNAASTVGDFFSKSVIPKLPGLIETIGRFISRTLFSKQLLTVLTDTAGVLGGIAVVVALQFVKGFAEGIYERRADIAHVLATILSYAVETILGSGNPLLVLGAALVAVFAGAKLIGAIGNLLTKGKQLTTNLSAGFSALGGHVDVAAAKVKTLRDTTQKISSTGVGKNIPTQMLAIRNSATSTASAVSRAGDVIQTTWYRLGYAMDTLKENYVKTAVTAQMSAQEQQEAAEHNTQVQQNRATALQGIIGIAGGAVAGYFAGMSKNAGEAFQSTIGAVSGIAIAFANPAGYILGPLSILSTAIGTIFGRIQADAAKARAVIAARQADIASLTGSFETAIKATPSFELDPKATSSRFGAAVGAINDQLQTASSVGSKFFTTFQVGVDGISAAWAKGGKALDAYYKKVGKDETSKIFGGDTTVIKRFADQISSVQDQFSRQTHTYGTLNDTVKSFASGRISVKQLTTDFENMGDTASQARSKVHTLQQDISGAISNFAKSSFGADLSPALRKAIGNLELQGQAQGLVDQYNKAHESAADKLSDSWNTLSGKIQDATNAYQAWLNLHDKGKTPLAQSRLSIESDFSDFRTANSGDARQVALSQGKQDFASAQAQLVTEATVHGVVNQKALNLLTEQYRKTLAQDILPGLVEQNKQLGKNALPMSALLLKAQAFIRAVTAPIDIKPTVTLPSAAKMQAAIDAAFQNLNINTNVVAHAASGQQLGTFASQGANGPVVVRSAAGRIVDKKMLSWLGENGREVVLPLTNPARAMELAEQSGLLSILSRQIGGLGPKPTPASPEYLQRRTPSASYTTPGITQRNAADLANAVRIANENALRGVAKLAKTDPAADAFFHAFAHATQAQKQTVLTDYANAHTVVKPKEVGGLHDLATKANAQSGNPGHVTQFDQRLDAFMSKMEASGLSAPLVDGDINVYGQTEPKAAGIEVVRQLKTARFLKVGRKRAGVRV